VAGVPAKVVRIQETDEPSRSMDQTLSDLAYQSFNYTI
jgi:serine acetyltransferase